MKLPPLGEGVTAAILVEWALDVGDVVEAGDVLLTVELDKVDSDIPSPVAGTLIEQAAGVGDELQVGQSIAVIEA